MKTRFQPWLQRALQSQQVTLAFLCCVVIPAQAADAGLATELEARYAALRNSLDNSLFHRPLVLESKEVSGKVTGDVYAVIDAAFPATQSTLHQPERWCDILILHINTKYCRAAGNGHDSSLDVRVGSKTEQTLAQAYQLSFTYHVTDLTPGYLRVVIEAAQGPLGTHDYQVILEGIPLRNSQTFLHLRYANAYGLAGRVALKAYLATLGASKVGFTVIGADSNHRPKYIGGLRGVVERNAMRYYLAVEAYLGSLSAPQAAQTEKRLRDWYAGAEVFALQLHDVEESEYLDMKRKEIRRQEAADGTQSGLALER
jgi:hypothetical protein